MIKRMIMYLVLLSFVVSAYYSAAVPLYDGDQNIGSMQLKESVLILRIKINSILKVAGKLDVTWKTVKNRFYELLKDCKVWIEFYPRRKSTYSQVFLTFKTEYEIGLRNELQKLNRTSVIFKVGNTILLTLYLRNNLELYSFLRLKKEGLIHDLEASISAKQWTKTRRVGPKETHPRYQADRLLRGVQKASL